MKVLITGAAGFIGSNLFNKLCLEGYDVYGIDNLNDDLYSSEIKKERVENLLNKSGTFENCDLFSSRLDNIFSENKIDVVVHLAAHAGVRPSIKNPEQYYRNNVLGTLHLVEIMIKSGCDKLVFASSSSVYGNCKEMEFKEDLVGLQPISPYAATKLACEEMLYMFHKLSNMNITCLRFFTVYGPEQRPDLAIHKFTDKLLEGEVINIYGDGHNVRDYTYIDDIVDGIKSAINYTLYNTDVYEIFNLGEGEPISISDMVRTIACELGKIPNIIHLPMQPGDVEKTVSNCDKAKLLLSYNPRVSFKEGISKFIRWKLKKLEK